MDNAVRRRHELVFFALIVLILLFILLNASLYFFRIDLTENKAFTISEVSRSLFKEIPEEVSITYFVTDKLKRYSHVPAQVEDLLNEYAVYSRGRINVSLKNPERSDLISQVEYYGITPQQVRIYEKNEQSFTQMYSGIVIKYLDMFKTLPVVFNTDTLEYDLTFNIRSLLRNEQRTIGILYGEDGKNAENTYRYINNQLSELFSIREIKQGETISPDISALIVLGCRDIDEYELFPIDQYIMRGGKVLFAVSGVSVNPQTYFTARKIGDAPVLTFLSLNGIDVKRSLLLDRYAKYIPMQTRQFYPHWISVIEKNTSRNNPITARFIGLDLLWPSPITISRREGLDHEAIVTSSENAWLMTEYLNANPMESQTYGLLADQTKGKYDLAVASSGRFTSYFKGRGVPSRKGEVSAWKEIIPESMDTRMVVIGNTDFASDLIYFSESFNNLLFLENVSEWLTNDDDLLSIKTRSSRDMGLNKIENPEQKKMALFYAEFLNIYIIPLLVLLAGVIRMIARRKKTGKKNGGGSRTGVRASL